MTTVDLVALAVWVAGCPLAWWLTHKNLSETALTWGDAIGYAAISVMSWPWVMVMVLFWLVSLQFWNKPIRSRPQVDPYLKEATQEVEKLLSNDHTS